jgi:hypothetical protein
MRLEQSATARRIAGRAALLLVLAFTAPLYAAPSDQAGDDDGPRPAGHHWGISLWGLSYHPNHNIDYEDANLGLGIRYYARPRWPWVGRSGRNSLFAEADVLRNSNRGVVVPLSAGAEYRVFPVAPRCSLYAVAALTVAYYENPVKDTTQIKWGPVPGVAIGCGHLKVNISAVLSASSRTPLAALVASMTIVF